MKRWIASAFGLSLLVMSPRSAEAIPLSWTMVSDKSAFAPRDSCAELVYDDRLWLLGGWKDSFVDPPRDVWSSVNGKEWTLVTGEAAWKHSDLMMTTVFKGRMWVMGGWHGGRLPHASASSAVWSSRDGAQWRLETEHAGWSPRLAAGIVVFNDRMWILGGIQKYYFGNDDDLRNDVWSSVDGTHWEQILDHAPWSPRAFHQTVVLGGKMYVIAGGNYVPNYQAMNDVWSTADGAHWTRETEAAVWAPRIWFSAITYRDRIWVLGGAWSTATDSPGAQPSRVWKNWNDVWTSADGKKWEKFATETTWSARHEHSTFVFDDALWVAAGHAAPLASDVWRLDVPEWIFPD